MNDVWERLETYLELNVPAIQAGLAPGATEIDIADFEATVGYQLPEDLRLSLLRHNGQLFANGSPLGGTLIPGGFQVLSLPSMLSEWQEHRDISQDLGNDRDPEVANPGVKPFFLHAAWIPIAADIGGNSICVDLDPGEGGTMGQIIEFDHEMDTPSHLSSDYRTWLTDIVNTLEAGWYTYKHDRSFPGFFPAKDSRD